MTSKQHSSLLRVSATGLSSEDSEISEDDIKFRYRHRKNNSCKLTKNKSAYMHFSMEARDLLRGRVPALNPNEVMKEISSLWKGLSDNERVKYKIQAKEDKERYQSEKKVMLKSNPLEITRNRTKANHVKKALSAYDFFMKERFHAIKEQNPTIMSAVILKLISREWRNLDLNQKAFYQGKSEEDKKLKKAQLKAVACKSLSDKSHVSFVSTELKISKKIKLNNNQDMEAKSPKMYESSYPQVFEPLYQPNDSFETQPNSCYDQADFQIREQNTFDFYLNSQVSPQTFMQNTPAEELSDFNFSFIEQASVTEREFKMPAPLLQPHRWDTLSFTSFIEPSNEEGLFQETDMTESENCGANMTNFFQSTSFEELFANTLNFKQDEKLMDFYYCAGTKHRKA